MAELRAGLMVGMRVENLAEMMVDSMAESSDQKMAALRVG